MDIELHAKGVRWQGALVVFKCTGATPAGPLCTLTYYVNNLWQDYAICSSLHCILNHKLEK